MNLVIADCEEFRRVKTRNKRPTAPGAPPAPDIESEEKRLLGLIILRGSNIISTTIEGPPPSDPSARLGPATGSNASALATGPGVSRPIGRGAPAPGLMGPAPGLGRPPGMGAPPPGFGPPGSMPPGFVPTPGQPSPFAPRKFPNTSASSGESLISSQLALLLPASLLLAAALPALLHPVVLVRFLTPLKMRAANLTISS